MDVNFNFVSVRNDNWSRFWHDVISAWYSRSLDYVHASQVSEGGSARNTDLESSLSIITPIFTPVDCGFPMHRAFDAKRNEFTVFRLSNGHLVSRGQTLLKLFRTCTF